MATGIHGQCEPRFGALRDVFAEGFRTRNEIGAALAVTIDGAPVVDLWAGHADLRIARMNGRIVITPGVSDSPPDPEYGADKGWVNHRSVR